MPKTTPLLEVSRLSIGIRRETELLSAVDDISFSVRRGEILGIVGESGCGKSLTCLSIVNLLPEAAKITGGTIAYFQENAENARNMASLSERELCRIRGKEIAMIFQEPRQSLNPLEKIGPQITETLELHGMKNRKTARQLALEMLTTLGFGEPEAVFRSYPHQLSGGMCQRVMIAIAAICRPRLLIADEPSAALDAAAQDQILALLGRINRDFNTAILFVSHDLSVVHRFCERFLVMYAGKILEEGPAELLFSAPAHPYTKGLTGAIPRKERRGSPLANIPGRVPSIESRLPGCPFAPRCAQAQAQCSAAFPPEARLSAEHRVHCFAAEARYD
ncbi:MAG: ABC transporter ATP-binding protein [Treponema sp.]|nr:ABC transporter ATP-binding protein [Treponema sp.]